MIQIWEVMGFCFILLISSLATVLQMLHIAFYSEYRLFGSVVRFVSDSLDWLWFQVYSLFTLHYKDQYLL